jgi:hypothetical protein
MALAGFLVRGGFLLVVLPLVSLPSVAAIATVVAPVVESLVIGGQTVAGALIGAVAVVVVLVALLALGLIGAWFDLVLVGAAAADDEGELALEVDSTPVHVSLRHALTIRLIAHLPTALALVYGASRIVAVAYDELTSPGDATVPLVARVFERTPDAVLLLVLGWLVGETVGPLAVRRVVAGASTRTALLASVRQLVHPRGLATLGLTSAGLLAIMVPFLVAVGRTWEHLRTYLLGGAEVVPLAAALTLLVGTWILGLSMLGAGLAWRACAWSFEVGDS